jgi:hypothetical protein
MKIKSFFSKHLPLISFLSTIVIAIVGFFINSNIQNKFTQIELENRTYTYRPKIELKNINVSGIVLKRDTNWIRPKVDIIKGQNLTTPAEVSMLTYANFSFTLINNSDNLADLFGVVFFDTVSSIPKPTLNLATHSGKDSLSEGYIQLDYLDSTTFNFTDYLYFIDDGRNFYLHFIVYYHNKFDDMYETYFVIKGKVQEPELLLIELGTKYDFARIEKMYMKNSYITLDKPKKYVSFLSGENQEKVQDRTDRVIKKHNNKKKMYEKLLNNP